MTPLRPSWVEIDLGALKHNVALVRQRVGQHVRIFAVVKSHGFGCGVAVAAKTVVEAGADALAVGNPDDVRAIREAGITAPVLLYASTPPEAAAEVAALGAIVTLHDMESLAAFAALDRPVEAFMKVEAGLGRLGIRSEDWPAAFAAAWESNALSLTGIYTHLNGPDDRDGIARQVAAFGRAAEAGRAAGYDDLTRMVASSHIVLGYPELNYEAVNPGRCLFGLIDGHWAERAPMRPVIAAVKSRIIQVKEFPAGERVGFLGAKPLSKATRLAVLPLGFGDGLNHQAPLGEVLVEGQRAPVVGRRGIEHTVVDVTELPAVRTGSEVVLLGRQGAGEISGAELCGWLGLPQMELLPRLAGTLPRLYLE
ncbi:MAG: alanine racemase [Alphaproteobacteria bacterium]|jgi:alanine racemase|nr:alanine racemase [Alphaproteobacteria bacterium]